MTSCRNFATLALRGLNFILVHCNEESTEDERSDEPKCSLFTKVKSKQT